jgi:hypothetical protein
MIKIYTASSGNRASVIALALVALGAASLFFVLGLALLAGLLVVGGVLGTGFSIYNRLRGRPVELSRETTTRLPQQRDGLDPRLEVFPETRGQVGKGSPTQDDR